MFTFKRLNIPRISNFSFGHNHGNYMQNLNLYQSTKKFYTLFDRTQEFDLLTSKFSSNIPKLHVILGPTDSGKTTLVRQVVQDGNFNPLFVNLRSMSALNLINGISKEFQNFFKKVIIRPELDTARDHLDYEFLEKISNSFPSLSYWKSHNIPPPILVMDEANLLFNLNKLDKYKILFKTFLS